jgi:hypothetical protein
LFYVVALTAIGISLADGPGDSEGMLAAVAGMVTAPIPILAAWYLYRVRVCRWILYPCAVIGLLFFLAAIGMGLWDVLTRPPGF